jgi:hypothetical protein
MPSPVSRKICLPNRLMRPKARYTHDDQVCKSYASLLVIGRRTTACDDGDQVWGRIIVLFRDDRLIMLVRMKEESAAGRHDGLRTRVRLSLV